MYAIFDSQTIYGVAATPLDAIRAWQAEGGTKDELYPVDYLKPNGGKAREGRVYLGKASQRIVDFMDNYDGGTIPPYKVIDGVLDFE